MRLCVGVSVQCHVTGWCTWIVVVGISVVVFGRKLVSVKCLVES